MSDSKKPTLSEIVWRNTVAIKGLRNDKGTIGREGALAISENVQYDIPYLLRLVKRMGKVLGFQQCATCEQYFGNPGEPCAGCKEARELLKEIEQ